MPTVNTSPHQEETRRKNQECHLHPDPDMARGFTITTLQGEINIDGEFARPFQQLAIEVLTHQLNQVKQPAKEYTP